MAYVDIGDIATGAVITEGYLDQIRANFLAGVPDIFTTKGDVAIATAADAAARLAVGADDSILVADASTATGWAWQIVPTCRAYNDADIALSAETWTNVTLNTERFDTDAMHSIVTDTERFTIPAGGAGLYSMGATVTIRPNAGSQDGTVGVRLLLNGVTIIGATQHDQRGTADATLTATTLYSLAATDYVQAQAYAKVASKVIATAAVSPEFWVIWQRRT